MKLTYKAEKEIEREYGAEAICGYLRSPEIHNGRIKGLCALCEGWKCKKYPPFKTEDCSKYKEKFTWKIKL